MTTRITGRYIGNGKREGPSVTLPAGWDNLCILRAQACALCGATEALAYGIVQGKLQHTCLDVDACRARLEAKE